MSETQVKFPSIPALEFDRGTILIHGLTQAMTHQLRDLIHWDERTNSWRAPAYTYANLVKGMNSLSKIYSNQVRQEQQTEAAWLPVSLRNYQEAALEAWRASAGRGVICLPTGAGKTRLALAAAQRSQKSTLCLVPTRVLLEQWQDSIREFYPGAIGIIGDGQHRIEPITIATFESAFRKAWTFGNRFDLLIIDEAHHFGDGERDEALEACTAPFRLGLSATIDDSQLQNLNRLIGPKVYEQQVRDLVGTALAEFDLIRLYLPLTAGERRSYSSDYSAFIAFFTPFRHENPEAPWATFMRMAHKTTEGRNALAAHRRAKNTLAYTESKETLLCQLLRKHHQQKVLIFTADANTAFTIAKRLLIAPITAEITKSEREDFLHAFKSGSIQALVSCKVLNEGFNVPEAEVAIIIGGSGSDREHIQRIGRVLRPKQGKRAAIYELLAENTAEVSLSRRRGAGLYGH